MAKPLRYSIQPSVISPPGFEGEYIRLQVDLRPELEQVVIPAADYDKIATALREGRALGLKDDSGRVLGQFATGLAGGFDAAKFTQATQANVRVSFKPTQELLLSARTGMTFELVPTVVINPTITKFTSTIINGSALLTHQNKICLDINAQNTIEVTGTNFVKNGMNLSVIQFINGITVSQAALLPALTSGTKKMSFAWQNTNTTPNFVTGAQRLPNYTRLVVSWIDNPSRSTFIDMEFIGCGE